MKSNAVWNLLYTLCNLDDSNRDQIQDILRIISLPNDAWEREGDSFAHHPHVIRYLQRCRTSAKRMPMFEDLVMVRELPSATRACIDALLDGEVLKILPSRSIEVHVENLLYDMKIRYANRLQEDITLALRQSDLEAIDKAVKSYMSAQNQGNGLSQIVIDNSVSVAALFNDLCDSETDGVPVPTGWDNFDSRAKGLPGAGITFITAPVGHGKSHMVVELACSMAMKQDIVVAIMSLEMTIKESFERVTRRISDIGYDHTLASNDAGTQKRVFRAAKEGIRGMKGRMQILEPESGADIIMHLESARAIGARVIFIDYLQLYQGTDSRINRTEYLKSLPTRVKAWCQKHKICVVLLAQLNSDGKIYGSTLSNADCDCWLSFEYPKEMREVGQIEVHVEKHRHTQDNWQFNLYADYARSLLTSVHPGHEERGSAKVETVKSKYLGRP